MSRDIFVFIECKDGLVRKVSFELLSKAKEIVNRTHSNSYAVLIGGNINHIAEELKAYADKIIVVNNDILQEYRWDTYTNAMELLIKKYKPHMVFGASTVTGKDFFPRLSARLNATMVSDAIGIDLEDEEIKIKKPLFGGKVISWVTVRNSETLFVTFRPNTFSDEKQLISGDIIEENMDVQKDMRLNVVGINKAGTKKIDLQESDFIICGGRGMKGPENFKILEEIAEIMEGRAGATRAVVDAKWRDYEDQIGKSGRTVSPKLYIGCGISGALHHTMGMDTSKVIVAINKDPNAPIFQYADYGIMDDIFDVLPVLKEELKKAKGEL